ncbi:murein biosynthesis integral membrane protein MurJ [Candidatus Nomurabacteria bacterium]|nr:murein biosynthesis integral membrane protein MurJ [Candidatus Nomurabacteria bacterium]
MVKKILSYFHKEIPNINQAALLLGLFAFCSQILALVRDRLLAHMFGPSPSLDVYYAAFRIPDFLYISIASLASITVLVPFFIKHHDHDEQHGTHESKRFLNEVFTAFLLVMIGISVVVCIFMPWFAKLLAPGFSGDQLHTLVQVSRIMLISPILFGVSNLVATVTQFHKKFFVYALGPVFYNIGILIGILLFSKYFGVVGLALGVILGALLQLIIQIPVIARHGYILRVTRKIDWNELRDVVKLSLPRTLGLAMNSIAIMGIVSLASLFTPGSISIFTFSYNLQSVPVNIFGVSYAVAAFPILAKFYSKEDKEGFLNHIKVAGRQIIFWSLPVMCLFIVLRAQIVRVILGSGRFSWADTRLTAAALALFVISLVAQNLIALLVRGYYASGNTKRPLIVNIISSVLIVFGSFGLVSAYDHTPVMRYFIESLLRVDDVANTKLLMLPLAYSIGSIINFFILWIYFQKDFLKGRTESFFGKTFIQSFSAACFMGFTSYHALGVFAPVFNQETFFGIFLQGFFAGIVGIIFGIFILGLMKNEQFLELKSTLHSKFWKSKSIPPATEL